MKIKFKNETIELDESTEEYKHLVMTDTKHKFTKVWMLKLYRMQMIEDGYDEKPIYEVTDAETEEILAKAIKKEGPDAILEKIYFQNEGLLTLDEYEYGI